MKDKDTMNELTNRRLPDPVVNDWGSRSHVQTLVLMAVTALGIYFCYKLAAPFLPALAWALALTILFTPLQCWLESKLKHPSMAALVSVMVIVLIVVVPVTFVVQRLAIQAANGAALIESQMASGEWRHILESQPKLAPLANRIEQQLDLPGTVKALATWLSSAAASIVKGSFYQALGFCLTFYLLFFFLRDRRAVLLSLRVLSPLSKAEMERLFDRVGDTVYATIYGTLAVSAVQGLLGGLMFYWLGLPAPLLWGVVMALLAVVPVLGAFVVWTPAALFLAMQGSWGKALILILWGALVVGTIDNLLRPILIGKRLKLHTVLAFIALVGGLMVFGPAGLILGPVTLTITTVLLEIWRNRTAATEMPNTGPDELFGHDHNR
jgi:predicted PurR-regulated permease PerM